MKELELTFEQVEILRDCLHAQIVNLYEVMRTTSVKALSDATHNVIVQMEDIDELLKY